MISRDKIKECFLEIDERIQKLRERVDLLEKYIFDSYTKFGFFKEKQEEEP